MVLKTSCVQLSKPSVLINLYVFHNNKLGYLITKNMTNYLIRENKNWIKNFKVVLPLTPGLTTQAQSHLLIKSMFSLFTDLTRVIGDVGVNRVKARAIWTIATASQWQGQRPAMDTRCDVTSSIMWRHQCSCSLRRPAIWTIATASQW
jgi:hypothetical protein